MAEHNVLHKNRIDALRTAYEKGLSHRAAAAECGIPRNTVARYFNRWSSADWGGEMNCIVKGAAKRRWKEEAEKREMSLRELLGYIVETIADDDIFDAVID